MAVRADPGHAILLAQPRRQAFHRHDAAPCHEAGEGGTCAAEQRFRECVNARHRHRSARRRSRARRFPAAASRRFASCSKPMQRAPTCTASGARSASACDQRRRGNRRDGPASKASRSASTALAPRSCTRQAWPVLNSRISLAVGTEAIASIAGRRPSSHSTREPFGEICTPAPSLAQFGGLLIQGDLEAALQQRQRGDDAADAGTGDQDAWLAQVPSSVRCRETEAGTSGRMQAGGRHARSTTDPGPREAVGRVAVAAASPRLCGEGSGGQPAFHRGHPGHSAGRHLVRARVPARGRARGGLLPHLLSRWRTAARWRSSSSRTRKHGRRTARSCRRLADRGMSPSRSRRRPSMN